MTAVGARGGRFHATFRADEMTENAVTGTAYLLHKNKSKGDELVLEHAWKTDGSFNYFLMMI